MQGTPDRPRLSVFRSLQHIYCQVGLAKAPPSDAADALAIAICQAHAGKLAGLGVRSGGRRRYRPRDHIAGRDLG